MAISRADILSKIIPYHHYSVGKYACFELDYLLRDLPEHSDKKIEKLRSHIAAHGIPLTKSG